MNHDSRSNESAREDYHKFRRAFDILRAAAYAETNGNAGQYADYLNKGRGIDLVPENAEYLPATLARKLCKIGCPAMVLPITNNADKLQGAQVTFLSRDGTRNARSKGKNVRRTYGPTAGGYIQLGTPDRDRPLIVAEGVEDALAASQLTGLPAIATVGTSNMKDCNPPPCSELIIAADDDDAGAKAADALAQRIVGVPVRIAFPPEGFKDWNEALRSDTDRDDLKRELLRAPKFKAVSDASSYSLSMAEVMRMEFPLPEYLLEPWLETGSLAMCVAQRGVGKTRFMMSVAYAIATGTPLAGWTVQHARRVLYVDGELQAAKLQQRMEVLGEDAPIEFLSRDVLLRTHRINIPDLGEEAGRKFIDKVIVSKQIEVVILDSLSTLVRSGVENEAESWTALQDWTLGWRFRGVTIIFVHHEGRNQKPRGTSKREDVLDTIVQLKEHDKPGGDDELLFELRFTKARDFTAKAPLLLRLSTASGVAEWTSEPLRERTTDRVLELHAEGLSQEEIAREVGKDQSSVSRILKKAKHR